MGIGLDIFGVHLNDSSSFWLMIHGLWVGSAIGVIAAIVTNLSRKEEIKEIERSEEQQRQAELVARKERKTKEDKQERERCLTKIHEACDGSVDRFEMLPADLKIAYDWLLEARQHLGNNAYSPFWQAIENAYSSLGYFKMRIDHIEALARQYSNAVQKYRRVGGVDQIPSFPVKMDMTNATRASESIASVANGVVYRAQCEAVFAQIWEQRRTTAAVVLGFANLEQAVAGMSNSVNSSLNLLTSTLSDFPSDAEQFSTESNESKLRMNHAANSLHAERWRASPLS